MLGRQRLTVHLIAEKVIGVKRFTDRHAACEPLRDRQIQTALAIVRHFSSLARSQDSYVVADGDRPAVHAVGLRPHSRSPRFLPLRFEYRGERRTRPVGITDSATEEIESVIARALDREIQFPTLASSADPLCSGTGDARRGPRPRRAKGRLVQKSGLAIVVDIEEPVSRGYP